MLPKLYKQNTDGSIQEWSVYANNNEVHSIFGRLDGKMQTTIDLIKGKNIGKVNEITDEEQAVLKAKQMYEKKIKSGYTPDLELAKSTKNTLKGIKPMLAFPIEKKENKVVFPAIVQPKLDGMRCIAIVENYKCTLYSRSQKIIPTLPHINKAIERTCELNKFENIILDGELYNHEDKDNFNRLMSLIKRDEPHKDCEHIEYHIYDIVNEEENFYNRTEKIASIIDEDMTFKLHGLDSYSVNSKEDIEEAFRYYLNLGYEGAMYRNPQMPYESKRSNGLLKVKVMDDAEFEIIGVNEGNGRLKGHAGAFVCKCKSGTFKAKLKGKLDELKKFFENQDEYIGKMLTVQFQGLTPDGIPRFPVGLRIRGEE